MNPVIQQYQQRVILLELIMDEMGLKEYCAENCLRLPVGCCNDNYFNRMVPYELESLQRQEVVANGLECSRLILSLSRECIYHTTEGCKLTTLKSPACVGFLCKKLEDYVAFKYVLGDSDVFIKNMKKVSEGSLVGDADSLFSNMDTAIETGKALIELNHQ